MAPRFLIKGCFAPAVMQQKSDVAAFEGAFLFFAVVWSL